MSLLGFQLSLLKKESTGWSGISHIYRIRLLNDRPDFPRSYWIAIGQRIHPRSIKNDKGEGITKARQEKQDYRIKTGSYEEQ